MAWSKKRKRRHQEAGSPELVVLPFSPLTEEEERDLLHLERKVERAFFIAGASLREIRDRRLFRNSHATFEEYGRQ